MTTYPPQSIMLWLGKDKEEGHWRLVYLRDKDSAIDLGSNCEFVKVGNVTHPGTFTPGWVVLYQAKERE